MKTHRAAPSTLSVLPTLPHTPPSPSPLATLTLSDILNNLNLSRRKPGLLKAGRRRRASASVPRRRNEVLTLDRALFTAVNAEYGPFTLDAHADPNGFTAQVSTRYYTSLNPFTATTPDQLVGDKIWCFPPMQNAKAFVKHYLLSKRSQPQLSAVFLLPLSTSSAWRGLLSSMQLVGVLDKGTTAFKRLTNPDDPCLVPAEPMSSSFGFFYDAPQCTALPRPCDPNPALHMATPVTPKPSSPMHNALPLPRIMNLNSIAAGFNPPQLLVVPATINGVHARLLIDSGAAGDFIDSKFVNTHNLSLSPLETPLRIRQANGALSTADQCVSQAELRLGVDVSHRDFTVTRIEGFDGVLGMKWLQDVNPVIDWPSQSISAPFALHGTLAPHNSVHIKMVKASKIAKAMRAGHTVFLATLQQLQPEPEPQPDYESDPFKPLSPTLSRHSTLALHACMEKHRAVFDEPHAIPQHGPMHQIPLHPDARPPIQRTYRMSPAELAEVQKQLQEYIEKGWIRPSTSEYGAPILFARKADGSLRMCVDYRALNALSVKDRYPLPRIDELLDQLHGAAYFTSLDLWSGYHQVRMHPDDIHKTAFKTRYGSFEFTVLPFGLTNAPATFMRLMNDTLRPYLDKFVVVYLDDVLIFSRTESEHIEHIDLVLTTLAQAQLKVKISKCSFAQPSTKFLGFIVSKDGISVDPKKVAAVSNWTMPADVTGIRSFLGFTGFYRRFIKDYAKIASPLTALTKTTVPFPKLIPMEAIEAFKALQTAVISAPVLLLPFTGPDALFELYTDASDKGIGAVLLQDQGAGPQPVSFESRKLRPAELNYPVHEQELLAVVHGIKTYRHYLEGCKHFTLYTDHHSLKFFFTQKNLSKRQARWAEDLAAFQPNMEIVYRPGPENQADALSRIFNLCVSADVLADVVSTLASILPNHVILDDTIVAEIKTAYAEDPYYSDVSSKRPSYITHNDGFWYFQNRLCIPRNLSIRERLLHEFHDTPSAGHSGHQKTLSALSQHFWWPHMTRTVKAYVQSCHTCQRTKPSTQCTPGLLQPHAIPERPWSHVSVDLVTDLPKSLAHDGIAYDTIGTFVCMFTKQAILVRTNKTVTSPALANIFLEHVYAKHGLPDKLVSDRDPRFNAEFWRTLFGLLGTKLNMSTAHHPQTDGQTERTHRTIEQILRAYVHPHHDDWAKWLPMVEFAYNNSLHSSINQTPFYANYGYHPATPGNFIHIPGNPASSHLESIKDIQALITRELELVKAQQSEQANKRRREVLFSIGDQVKLSTDHLTLLNQPSSKFRSRFLGPFRVTEVVSPVAYRLALPQTMKCHPVFHVSRLLPWLDNVAEFPNRPIPDQPLPAAKEYVYGDVFTVQSIADVKLMPDPQSRARPRATCLFFLVKWAPPFHDPAHDSWEPLRNLKRLDALSDFLSTSAWSAFSSSRAYLDFAAKHKNKLP
jgi:RNase H-like domain found in reverse transcriptase/Reverse transcriptase (RNA-dependent DNA polymerase)/Integrase zinc binding domain/Retroviral aspartyl protease/DNA N-6-adenine-methyltransferase (Dam)